MSPAHGCIRDNLGNLLTFEQIYDRFFNDVFQHILRRVGQVAIAQDLTATTFEKVMNSLGRFQWRGVPVNAWVLRIATNQVNTYFRKQKYTPTEDLVFDLPSRRLSPEEELVQAERELENHQMFKTLTVCLRQLKPLDQSLIVMRYLEGRTYQEIGQILKKRTGTLATRTHRALGKLKDLLERRGLSYERFKESTENPAPAHHRSGKVQAEFAG